MLRKQKKRDVIEYFAEMIKSIARTTGERADLSKTS